MQSGITRNSMTGYDHDQDFISNKLQLVSSFKYFVAIRQQSSGLIWGGRVRSNFQVFVCAYVIALPENLYKIKDEIWEPGKTIKELNRTRLF